VVAEMAAWTATDSCGDRSREHAVRLQGALVFQYKNCGTVTRWRDRGRAWEI